MRLSCTVRETLASAMCVRLNICPRRLMDRPGGYGPSDARSIRAGDTVTVADMVMQRIVVPPHAGSNPVSHPYIARRFQCPGYLHALFSQVHMRDEGIFVSRDL